MPAERFFSPFFDLVGAPASMRAFVLGELATPHRHWHGLLHHALVLRSLARGRHDIDAQRRLILAALFHDIVYDARRSDNEEASAETARRWVTDADAEPVAALILATKAHDLDRGDPATRALLLADLGVLWTPSAALYDFYARGIRAEYAHVPDDAYCAGRTAVLRKLRDQLSGQLSERDAAMMTRNLDGEINSLADGAFGIADKGERKYQSLIVRCAAAA